MTRQPSAALTTLSDPLRRDALADPLLALARSGELPAASYDAAFDAIEERQSGAYRPEERVAEYLRVHWAELLSAPAIPQEEAPKRGRPTLLTAELIEQAQACAEDGMKDPQIYAELGIARQTWSDWTKEGGEGFQRELSDAIARARARLARRLLRLIPTMEKGWQAPVWLLTQHFPQDYSRPNAETTVNVSASASAAAETKINVTIPPEKLADLQARMRRQLERATKERERNARN